MRATIEAGSVQAASDVVAELGEGPCWDGATLLWVDIPAGRLPVIYPTSCAFGGPDLADLYVTTASAPLSGRAPAT
jgi:sugar lactone lactonase YvrE